MTKNNFFTKYSKPVLFFGFLLLAAGVFTFNRMQTALFPEVTFPRITLIADAGQLPVDRMMITVTKPLENAVKRVKGVNVVKSSTSRGSCTIDVYFQWNLDIYNAKTQLESRVNEIKNLLPQGLNISIEAMNQSFFPVYGFSLESKKYGPIKLKDEANLLVRPLFSQVAGISNVIVRGGKAKEYVVIPDAIKMSALGITPATLINVFNNNNFVLSNGNLADFHRLYLTLTDTRVNDMEELGNVVIKNDGSRIIKLKDIANIDLEQKQEFVIINANGNDAVQIDLVKQQGENLIDFAKRVDKKAIEIRKLLPQGIELKPYYDQSAFVSDSIDSVIECIWEGLLLAIIVMILFLRSWRASLAVMLTIPVTLCLSVVLLSQAGITINIMSLGAIAAAIGLIIDDAIVVIEQIYRVHEEHPEMNKRQVVKHAIKDLFPAMVGSSLSTIVIFLPFAMMSGLAGAFFKELSNTMIIVLVASFLVTWLVLPVLHLAIGYRPHKHKHKPEPKEKLKWLTNLFYKPIFALIFIVILIIGAWLVSGKLETGFLPDLDEGTIVLDYYSPPGTSLQETDAMLRQVEKIIINHPEVESYSRRTGVKMGFKTCPPNYGDYLIQLKKSRKDKTVDVIDQIRKKIEATQPSLHVSFGQRIADLLGDLTSTPSPIEIKIFGDDQQTLEGLAKQASTILEKVNGIADIENGLVIAGPSIVFVPNQERLAQYNVSLTDFQTQLKIYTDGVLLGMNANEAEISPAQEAMAGGIQLGQIQEGEQMRKILMRFTNFNDNNLEKIRNRLIFMPDGTVKPLSFFADVKIIAGETELKREDLKTDVVLTARLNNRDLGSAIHEIQTRFKQELSLPNGYTIEYGGAYSEQQSSFRELLIILIAACLLVFGVLMILFREWIIASLILFISMIGMAGCILGLYFTGIPLNVSSYTGIIMIVGIIAENAIFTVNQFFYNLNATGDPDSSIKNAIILRIRPNLMTAFGAILALMPLALGIGLGAQMQQPLAVVVISGFLVAIPLLLFVLPSFLRILYKRKNSIES